MKISSLIGAVETRDYTQSVNNFYSPNSKTDFQFLILTFKHSLIFDRSETKNYQGLLFQDF